MDKILTMALVLFTLTSFAQTTRNGLDKIPKKWILLEKDSIGYLVYDPCNGDTPMIVIDNNYVTIYWQIDAPSKYAIMKFTSQSGNKKFLIDASNESGSIAFSVVIKDGKQKINLWTFQDIKWVMTPFDNRNNFRQVNNPCPAEMKSEKEFLPVEF